MPMTPDQEALIVGFAIATVIVVSAWQALRYVHRRWPGRISAIFARRLLVVQRMILLAMCAVGGALGAGLVVVVPIGLICELGFSQFCWTNDESALWFVLLVGAFWGMANGLDTIQRVMVDGREQRIRELIQPTLAAARHKATQTIDEADRQEELHRKARKALRRREVPTFRDAIEGITDLNRHHDSPDERGGYQALLIEASEAGAEEFLKALLAKTINVNHRDIYRGGHTALHIAAQNGRVGAVRLLIESGADVNARDGLGRTPLWSAARLPWRSPRDR